MGNRHAILVLGIWLVIIVGALIAAGTQADSRAVRRLAIGSAIAIVVLVACVIGAAWWYFSQWNLQF